MKVVEDKIPMATGIVARGRTVCTPHPTEKVNVGPHPITFQPMYVPAIVDNGPGSEVTLSVDDINRLRELGFLVDPSKIATGVRDGPDYDEQSQTPGLSSRVRG